MNVWLSLLEVDPFDFLGQEVEVLLLGGIVFERFIDADYFVLRKYTINIPKITLLHTVNI